MNWGFYHLMLGLKLKPSNFYESCKTEHTVFYCYLEIFIELSLIIFVCSLL